MTWCALEFNRTLDSKTGAAVRVERLRRSSMRLNCCGVIPIAPMMPAREAVQKQKTELVSPAAAAPVASAAIVIISVVPIPAASILSVFLM